MKKILKLLIVFCLAFLTLSSSAAFAYAESDKIYLGGMAAGFSINTKGAEVVGVCDVITDEGVKSPAKETEIAAGDIIISIGEVETDSAADVAKAIEDGADKNMILERNGEKITANIKPVKDISGEYKIGVFIRDRINGIGTITYIKGEDFAALGHPVLRSDGSLMKITGGELFNCSVSGSLKGERGKAGELKGVFVGKRGCGIITDNEYTGVYGKLNADFDYSGLKEIETGEGKVGDAYIYSTVNSDGIKEYKISIIKVDDGNSANKNFVVKVVDDSLIGETGGIVQGMSGSPIVQDGKLIGAITHVFINDPTRGFAISIDNMLKNQTNS